MSAAVEQFLEAQTKGLPGAVSYTFGPLDRHAQQAACSAFEPFLPPGNRLWGRSTIGVRCLGPTAWSVYVPVQVKITGKHLSAARQLAAGQVIAESDLSLVDGDLGALPATVLTDPRQAIGKALRNGLAAGQALRSDALITPWAVQQGQMVKLLANGPGFTVTNEGKALSNATDGQLIQVRTNSGQIVSGIARHGGVVEVRY
ncbi:MAG: flagellar basal body P-ring formation chaperone FlgA [Candidatus Accumulibacter sp.]|uniref:flagellar basal body P-ring formation chaperone FlgA n=1 Tax=Accumulibacter sp. TaxID=2053492 RepID=UPI00287AC306|nr:flagellar basal body P-ring formation chaperone FlgA [Accumulibacter sp.]MDS4016191.1 flagellar basal body P-ring formation chaperone FlgA [Accumulibacter sp.]